MMNVIFFEKAKRLASKKHDLLRKNLSVEVCVYNFVNIYTCVWKSLFPFVLFNVALFQFGKPRGLKLGFQYIRTLA